MGSASLIGRAAASVATFLARVVLLTLVGLVLWARAPVLVGCSPEMIATGSMHGPIAPGDVVVACPTHSAALRPGMIVVADDPSRPGALRTHRIVALRGNALVLRGDANPSDDPRTVARRAVHGVVRLVVPWVGLPEHWAHTRAWDRLAAAISALFLLVVLAFPDLVGSSIRTATARRARATRRLGQDDAGTASGAEPYSPRAAVTPSDMWYVSALDGYRPSRTSATNDDSASTAADSSAA